LYSPFQAALPKTSMARARRIQSEVIGVDSHIDTLQRVLMEKVDIANVCLMARWTCRVCAKAACTRRSSPSGCRTFYKGAEAIRRHA